VANMSLLPVGWCRKPRDDDDDSMKVKCDVACDHRASHRWPGNRPLVIDPFTL
jgi:hypothetical protein